MACQACNGNGLLPTPCDNGQCDISIAAMRVTEAGVWPGTTNPMDNATPPGAAMTSTDAPASRVEVTSNCLFGPTNETLCTRRVRMVEHAGDVYSVTSTLGVAGEIGFSPYDAGATVLAAAIDTARLTACMKVCEINLRVQRPAGTYVIGSAAAGAAVGKANMRSAWYATENNVANPYSTANISKFGTRLRSTDGRCNCDCVWGWSPFDISGQLEFTYGGGLTPAAGDIVTLEFQVERTYVAARECKMPERCGQPLFAAPAVAP